MSDKTPEELRYSRPLDVHKWSDHSEVNDFVDQLWDEFLASEFAESVTRGKRPKTSLKQQFKVLLLDLYIAWKEDPELLIGVAMSKSSYKTNSRYNALHISQKMIDLINYLQRKKKYKNIYFIMGADNLINFHKWHKWKSISQKCNILVFDRQGYKAKSLKSITFKRLNQKSLEFIKFKKVNISSSQLRKI